MSKENYIEEIRPHDSAYKHVSGYAEYTDDINEPKNTIYGAIGLSKKSPCNNQKYWPRWSKKKWRSDIGSYSKRYPW